jgi:murein DD-endopeptidase MepM/ murein hydrolase activator NlpD
LPSRTSPAIRALRRFVARDPETPLHFDRRGSLASLRAAAVDSIRPVARSLDELLGGGPGEAARTFTSETEGRGDSGRADAVEAGRGTAGRRATRASDAVGNALVGLARHRRSLGLAACFVLMCAVGVSAMPPISVAGGPDPTDIYIYETPGTDTLAFQAAVQPGGVDYLGDGSIYNVMQAADAPPGTEGFRTYAVQGGDTLTKIGAKFGLSYRSVYWANTSRLPDPSKLRIGQKLMIPPADGVTVTVKAGDTLSGFASKYRVSTRAIQNANSMTGTTLTIGQLLLIPVSPPALPAPKVQCGVGCVWTGGKLLWPVPSSHTITQYYSSVHRAIDIGAHYGSPVIAAYGGKVIWAGWKTGAGSGGGIVVWVDSGGKLYETYNHLSRVYVKKGQIIKAGQHIANVGSTGMSTGPHLHFEVWSCYPWTGGTMSCARNPLLYM